MNEKPYDQMTPAELEFSEYGRRVPSWAVTGYAMLAIILLIVLAICLFAVLAFASKAQAAPPTFRPWWQFLPVILG